MCAALLAASQAISLTCTPHYAKRLLPKYTSRYAYIVYAGIALVVPMSATNMDEGYRKARRARFEASMLSAPLAEVGGIRLAANGKVERICGEDGRDQRSSQSPAGRQASGFGRGTNARDHIVSAFKDLF